MSWTPSSGNPPATPATANNLPATGPIRTNVPVVTQIDGSNAQQTTIRVIPGSQLQAQAIVSGAVTTNAMIKTSPGSASSLPTSTGTITNTGLQSIAPNTIRVFDGATIAPVIHHTTAAAAQNTSTPITHSTNIANHNLLSTTAVHLTTGKPIVQATGVVSNNSSVTSNTRPLTAVHTDTKPTISATSLVNVASHNLHPIGSVHHHVSGVIHPQVSCTSAAVTTVHTASSTPTAQQQQQFQRLKVEDALSYLDKVKFKFNNQPQVYNDFLDIMKEFKSQSIDTPGVIQRVSNLFRGHPELIVGFNTFLPPGYKIEMQANDQVNVSMPNMSGPAIIISAPPASALSSAAQTGTGHTSTLATNIAASSTGSVHVQPNVIGTAPTPPTPLSGALATSTPLPKGATAVAYSALTTSATGLRGASLDHTLPNQIPATATSLVGHQQLSAAAVISASQTHGPTAAHPHPATGHNQVTLHGSGHVAHTPSNAATSAHQNSALSGNSQPVEFNHAINYVNKIKNRFQGQPEVYKQFLEILHAYQKEQKIMKEGKQPDSKPLTESEVYSKVAKLFQNQEDLLQEFGQFLPESNSAAMVTGAAPMFTGQPVHHYALGTVNTGTSGTNSIPVNASERTSMGAAGSLTPAHHLGDTVRPEHSTIVKRPIIRGSQLPSQGTGSTTQSANGSALHSGSPVGPPLPSNMKRQSTGAATVNTAVVGPQASYGHMHSPNKKPKMTCLRDVSLAEAGKFASLNEYAFFDKVRKVLKSQEVYDNFLRFLLLYNHEILSRSELLSMVSGFLGKYPELLRWFKDFIGYKSNNSNNASSNSNNEVNTTLNATSSSSAAQSSNVLYDALPSRVVGIRDRERINSEVAMEIDYASCKRYGASYRALPKNFPQPKCSGRTSLCKEVLNDTWVSFPSWSEDSTFVTSRKTQYEEYIYRCEDERFELDVVIETNLSAIRVFESVQKKMNRMNPEERIKFRLDDTLGGSSVILIQRAIRRIYGDKAPEIIEGLKKNPAVAVPLVYKRLKSKEEEWREAQKQFNKIWREQNEKYYLKSLDHQGISFKQNDIKYLRSKSLINEIESIYEERHEQNEENADIPGCSLTTGSHMQFVYGNKEMIEHACNLIIHHVKRQTSIHKEDKQKIKQLLRQFIPDLFATSRGALSDDEEEEDDEMDVDSADPPESERSNRQSRFSFSGKETIKPPSTNGPTMTTSNVSSNGVRPHVLQNAIEEDAYTLFVVNQAWYLFFRLHQILCERLGKMAARAKIICDEHIAEQATLAASGLSASDLRKNDSPACLLRLKPRSEYTVDAYFCGLVEMVKQLLDGNLDSNQFEDQLREMFGIHAYIAFTLDKVVQNLVRQLQHIVSDEHCVISRQLYLDAKRQYCAGGSCTTAVVRAGGEHAYQKRAEQLIGDDNLYKVMIYQREGKLSIELLDTECSDSEEETGSGANNGSTVGANTVRWSDYIERYVKDQVDISSPLKQRLMQKPLFLIRSVSQLRTTLDQTQEIELEQSPDPSENRSPGSPVNDIETTDKPSLTTAIDIVENTKCRFDVNSYKAVFVTDTGSYLYKRNSLQKAHQSHPVVQKRLHDKFAKVHQKWLKKNCNKEQLNQCEDWLSGRIYANESVGPTPTDAEPGPV